MGPSPAERSPAHGPLDRLRGAITAEVRSLLGTGELPAIAAVRPGSDTGLFGPRSVTWQVHASRAGLIGGLRALLLQTLHPLAMAGVADHSRYREDPWGRLRRTSAFIGVTTYGTTAAAEAAIERVRQAHGSINGIAPNGLPYRANDPALLAWVHATEVDSLLRAYRRYGSMPLDDDGADRYLEEMAAVATRLGVLTPPLRRSELARYFTDVRPTLRAERQAFEAVRFLLFPPLPLHLRPAYGLVAAAAVGLLPGWARRELRIVVPPLSDPLLVRPAVRVLLGALDWAVGPPPGQRARADAA